MFPGARAYTVGNPTLPQALRGVRKCSCVPAVPFLAEKRDPISWCISKIGIQSHPAAPSAPQDALFVQTTG